MNQIKQTFPTTMKTLPAAPEYQETFKSKEIVNTVNQQNNEISGQTNQILSIILKALSAAPGNQENLTNIVDIVMQDLKETNSTANQDNGHVPNEVEQSLQVAVVSGLIVAYNDSVYGLDDSMIPSTDANESFRKGKDGMEIVPAEEDEIGDDTAYASK